MRIMTKKSHCMCSLQFKSYLATQIIILNLLFTPGVFYHSIFPGIMMCEVRYYPLYYLAECRFSKLDPLEKHINHLGKH